MSEHFLTELFDTECAAKELARNMPSLFQSRRRREWSTDTSIPTRKQIHHTMSSEDTANAEPMRFGPAAKFAAKAKATAESGNNSAASAAFKVNKTGDKRATTGGGDTKTGAKEAENKAFSKTFSAEEQKKRDEANLHPLQHEWCFWFNGRDKLDAKKKPIYGSGQEVFGKFSTVEDFWTIFHNLVDASKVLAKMEYGVFKSGIAPKWEDPANGQGGTWHLSFDTTKGNKEEVKSRFNEAWLTTLLLMIGEQFEHNDEINGAILAVRKDRLEARIWVKTAAEREKQLSIGKTWFEGVQQFAQTPKVAMKSHTDPRHGPSWVYPQN